MTDGQQHNSEASRRAAGEILSPLSIEEFIETSFGKAPLHLKGKTGRFRHLLDWDALARILETHPLEFPRLKIVRAGEMIPQDRYLRRRGGVARIDGGALSLLLATGATVIVDRIDDLVPGIAAIADDAGDLFAAETAANLYATRGSEHGFGPHWDSHDVIVLQLTGSKKWQIYRPARTNPLSSDALEALSADAVPESVEFLEDGDMLYLPRGWIHAPLPLGEPSMHLTISIDRPNGAGFLDWLAQELRDDDEVRTALPLPGDEASSAAWKESIGKIVQRAIAGGAIERFRTYKDAQRGARPRFSFDDFGRLPAEDWNEATLLRPSSLHRFEVESAAHDSAAIIALDRRWPCNRAVANAVALLTSTHPLTLGKLETSLSAADRAQLRQLLVLLATFGLLACEAGVADDS